MFAFKCDRCGKLYEAGTKPYRNVNDHLFLNRIINGKENMTDLCPDCFKNLEHWFYDFIKPSSINEVKNSEHYVDPTPYKVMIRSDNE